MIKDYYRLTKPGIIYGNVVTALAGFFLAAGRHVQFGLLLSMLAGLSLIIASACVINNYLDRDLDRKMDRTKNRALAAKSIPVKNALVFAGILLSSGGLILGFFTNVLTLAIALLGFVVYVAIYSPLKPRTSWATVIGSVAGATPPVVGYCASADKLNGAALSLLLILVFWQMPHFYSIAIFRLKDYRAAGVPVLPLSVGLSLTKRIIVLYIVAFVIAASLLKPLGYSGYIYLFPTLLLGFYWLWLGLSGLKNQDSHRWARKMFGTSLIVITLFSASMIIDAIAR